MKRQVIWSPASRTDLISIGRAIALDNPNAARSVTSRLSAAGEALGASAIGRPGRVSGTYEKVLPRLPYIIAYELVRDDGDEVIAVLRVIHTRRNWPAEDWPLD